MHNNWDIEIGQRLKDMHKELEFTIAKNAPHLIFKVGETRFYMIHRVSQTLRGLGTNSQKGVVFERLLRHHCDVLLLGHYHRGSCSGDQTRNLRLVINGCMGESDAFYAEENGYWSTPCQALIHIPDSGPCHQDDVVWLRW